MIYAIGDADGYVKFGIALRPYDRMDSFQTGNVKRLQLLDSMETEDDRFVEAELHHCLRLYRVRGEWFEPCLPVSIVVASFSMGAEFVLHRAGELFNYYEPGTSGLWDGIRAGLTADEARDRWLQSEQGIAFRAGLLGHKKSTGFDKKAAGFDKKSYQRTYMRDYRRKLRRDLSRA